MEKPNYKKGAIEFIDGVTKKSNKSYCELINYGETVIFNYDIDKILNK